MQTIANPASAPLAKSQADRLLSPLLNASGETQIQREMERVLAGVEPVIIGIVRRHWSRDGGARGAASQTTEDQTAEDIRGDVRLRLTRALHDLHSGLDSEPIRDFHGFAATTTYRVCNSYLQRKYPRRAGLKRKLVYLLGDHTGQKGFALWNGANEERICGFAEWQRANRQVTRTTRYQSLTARTENAAGQALAGIDPARANPGDVIAALFHWAGGPLELNDLVNVLAEVWQIREEQREEANDEDEGREDTLTRLADPSVNVANEVEQRDYLRGLWAEIRQLPTRQCAALLLNLRDAQGVGVIALLPMQDIAGLREIAAAMGISAEKFAEVWNGLPLDDNAIASLIGVTRQQVINLRKVARERLVRRMRSMGGTE